VWKAQSKVSRLELNMGKIGNTTNTATAFSIAYGREVQSFVLTLSRWQPKNANSEKVWRMFAKIPRKTPLKLPRANCKMKKKNRELQ